MGLYSIGANSITKLMAKVSIKMFTSSMLRLSFRVSLLAPVVGISTIFVSENSVAISSGGYETPKATETIEFRGYANSSELPQKFSLLSWNIEKAVQGEVWANDFKKLQPHYNVILIQEATSDSMFMNQIDYSRAPLNGLWSYFKAWIRKEDKSTSGLAMGGLTRPTSVTFTRTEDREPFIQTTKLTAYQTYRIKNSKKELLVINIHAINFVSTTKFARHVEQVMDRVDQHDGPVIFVGDMNTWNKSRLAKLKDLTSSRGLVHYDFERPNMKGMHEKLDHLFVRGLKVKTAHFLKDIVSSDHFPITAEFEFVKDSASSLVQN